MRQWVRAIANYLTEIPPSYGIGAGREQKCPDAEKLTNSIPTTRRFCNALRHRAFSEFRHLHKCLRRLCSADAAPLH